MRTLYLDCFGGASGDMILGALLDLGAPFEAAVSVPSRLGLEGVEVRVGKSRRSGLSCTDLKVFHSPGGHVGSLGGIKSILDAGELSEEVYKKSLDAFERLARAEGEIHGAAAEEVHFHEVGSPDTFVDIVGVMACLEHFGWPPVYASPLPLGGGSVDCGHGEYPLPSPATLKLLENAPVYQLPEPGERVTPTGAALLATVVRAFGPLPPMVVEKSGYGMGDRETPGRPNLLRAVLGRATEGAPGASRFPFETDRVEVLECDVDDASPEILGRLFESAIERGALDVVFTAAQMKKGRPGTTIRVLSPPGRRDELIRLIFEETTTFGVRLRREERKILARRSVAVSTEYGTIRVKVGEAGGEIFQLSPEYEDCRKAAEAHGVSVKKVYHSAVKSCKVIY